MSKKRRTKRNYEVAKRCHCADQRTCGHHWWLRVFSNGKRQRVDLTALFPNESVEVAAAKAKEMARRGAIVDGELNRGNDSRLTVADVAKRYVAARGGRKHYYLDGLLSVRVPAGNGTVATLGSKPVDDVTASDIKAAVAVWRARKRTLAGARKGQVAERHLLQSGRHLFNWALQEGLATRSPFYSLQGVPIIHVKASKSRRRRLEEGEEERILKAADDYVRDFFMAMIETGCRPGELRTLQWTEVRGDQIIVLETKAKDREERSIPIMPTLRAILDRRRIGPDGGRLSDSAFVFGNETGEEVTRRRLCGLWLDTCKRAKVVNLHLHDLRGEAGSQLLEAGVPIHEVRDALGHSSTTMTSTYLRTRTNSLQKAYEQRAADRARKAIRRVS
ncbi:MAG TPA: site-specific integrase [Vicinamibacterales bacterium]|nr:site-specific integrase [Vicinamibacterales bacterium]